MDSVNAAKARKLKKLLWAAFVHAALITTRRWSPGQGNVFPGVCLSTGMGVSVWRHFLSGCLVPCSFRRGLCTWSHVPSEGVSWGSLSGGGALCLGVGGICLGSLCRKTSPKLRKTGSVHPTGMLSCLSLNSLNVLFHQSKFHCQQQCKKNNL